MILRDSLGGNTNTVMVATVTGDAQHLDESMSTCRFAQRVALVANEVIIYRKATLALQLSPIPFFWIRSPPTRAQTPPWSSRGSLQKYLHSRSSSGEKLGFWRIISSH